MDEDPQALECCVLDALGAADDVDAPVDTVSPSTTRRRRALERLSSVASRRHD
jgi:hypothetical protein